MDNTLQIRLSADITALVSALTKAKNTIKAFESETEKESEKGNVGFKRKIGLIEQLTNKAKSLRTALSQATNEQQVERFNQELEQTSRELTRLNALGRSVTANLGSTAGGFGQVARQGANASGVALEFNRIIQDAPFGLIGIGNNLQQLAANFNQVKASGLSTSKALATSLTAIISPVNLGVLAISALTAGFTAYQLGVFDTILGNKEVEESFESLDDRLKEYIENLGSVETANLNAAKSIASERVEIDALVGVIEDETKSRETRLLALNKFREIFPGYLKGISDEKILSEGLRDVYLEITDAITKRATALALEEELVNLAKQRLELNKKLISDEDNFFKIQQELIKAQEELDRLEQKRASGQASASRVALAREERDNLLALLTTSQELATETAQGINTNKDAAVQLGQEYKNIYSDLLEVNSLTTEWDEGAQKIVRTYEKIGTTLDDVLQRARNQRRDDFFTGIESGEGGITIESGAASTRGIIIPDDVQKQVEDNLKAQLGLVEELSGAYAGLGSLIGKAFDNPQLGSFLGQFIPFAAKLIATNFKVGTSAAIAKGAQDSIFGGPFTTGAFIAAAVGLVATAFSSIGGGKGAGVSSVSASSGAPPQIFTNSQIPFIPSNPAPSPSGNIDFDQGQGRLTTTVSGGDIVFVYEREKERQQGGGVIRLIYF